MTSFVRAARRRAVVSGVAVALAAGSLGAFAAPAGSAEPIAQPADAIVQPLVEIGRVRARTPYCAALARARPGADAAVAFQFTLRDVVDDISTYSTDSLLAQNRSRRKTDRDVLTLWALVDIGRDDLRALRAAAADFDEPQRSELLGFVNALDGVRDRQLAIAKEAFRQSTFSSTEPVAIGWERSDSGSPFSPASRATEFRAPDMTNPLERKPNPADVDPTLIGAKPVTDATRDALRAHERAAHLFDGFGRTQRVREDFADAARHAINAMRLGGCTAL